MEAGLMEIVRSLNIIWIYDSYFSLYRPMSGGKCPDTDPTILVLIVIMREK